jgi:hypothetical protein
VRLHVKKQLAGDIESNGGIKHFAGRNNQHLYRLLQSRVQEDDNPYGNRGDPIRTKLRKLVNYWVRKDQEGKYISEVLNPWQIVQYMPQTRRASTNISVASSDDSDSDDSISAAAVRNPRPTSFSRPNDPRTPPRVINTNSQPPVTPLTPLAREFARMTTNAPTPNPPPQKENKRKIGDFYVEDVIDKACKYLGCLISDNFIV